MKQYIDPPETDDPEPEPFPEQPTETPQEDFGWEWTEGLDDDWNTY